MRNKEISLGDEIRNVRLPLAVTRPNLYEKLIFIGFAVFYLMCLISYLTNGFLTNYIFLELGLIFILILILSKIYDVFYISATEHIMDTELAGIVIGFSNKILVLNGEDVIEEIDTDEIKIRSVYLEEEETFFSKYTSVLECMKNGVIVGRVGVDKVVELEGITLKANMDRVDEDIVVIYDDDDDETDSDDGDFEEIQDIDNMDDLIIDNKEDRKE